LDPLIKVSQQDGVDFVREAAQVFLLSFDIDSGSPLLLARDPRRALEA
jgi:hypothetical protein